MPQLTIDLTDDELVVLQYVVFGSDPRCGDPLKDIYEQVGIDRSDEPWYERLETMQAKLGKAARVVPVERAHESSHLAAHHLHRSEVEWMKITDDERELAIRFEDECMPHGTMGTGEAAKDDWKPPVENKLAIKWRCDLCGLDETSDAHCRIVYREGKALDGVICTVCDHLLTPPHVEVVPYSDRIVRHVCDELDKLRERMPREPFDVRCADALADEVDVLIARKVIDSRSPAADALLDYRDPPRTERSDRLAQLETRNEELRHTLVRVTNETPYPDEIKGWTDQRAKLTAEIGTLKARIAELERGNRR